MQKIKLDSRLLALTKFIRKNSCAADIGTDHAFLPIYLIQQGICSNVIASDINPLPLKSAEKNITLHNVKNITTILSDGLDSINPGSFTELIIAGMGADTIINILKKSKWIFDSRYNLILQPMSNPHILREFLYLSGFDILNEEIVKNNHKLYVIINCKFNNSIITPSLYDCYVGKILDSESDLTPEYIKNLIKQLTIKADGIAKGKSNSDDANKYFELLNKLNEILKSIK